MVWRLVTILVKTLPLNKFDFKAPFLSHSILYGRFCIYAIQAKPYTHIKPLKPKWERNLWLPFNLPRKTKQNYHKGNITVITIIRIPWTLTSDMLSSRKTPLFRSEVSKLYQQKASQQYFRWCRPHHCCRNYLTVTVARKEPQTISNKGVWLYSNETFIYQNRWQAGFGLWATAHQALTEITGMLSILKIMGSAQSG